MCDRCDTPLSTRFIERMEKIKARGEHQSLAQPIRSLLKQLIERFEPQTDVINWFRNIPWTTRLKWRFEFRVKKCCAVRGHKLHSVKRASGRFRDTVCVRCNEYQYSSWGLLMLDLQPKSIGIIHSL